MSTPRMRSVGGFITFRRERVKDDDIDTKVVQPLQGSKPFLSFMFVLVSLN